VYLWVSYDSQIKLIISLNRVNHLIFVTETHCVFFEVRAEHLNIIKATVGFKALKAKYLI